MLGNCGEGLAIEKFHAMGIRSCDQASPLEIGEDPANGLDREPEMIGDVAARHRQIDAMPGIMALG